MVNNYFATSKIRGLRNNNPFNIRKGQQWQGEIVGKDVAFESFKSIEYGIRAGMKVIETYYSKHGLNTITEIINRFAPSSENNTTQYIAVVGRLTNWGVNEEIFNASPTAPSEREKLYALAYAITKHETGLVLTKAYFNGAVTLL